jgi:hypothetical protein
LALGSVSGIIGMPVEFEKRAVTGVEARVIWGARLKETASGEG